jgi:hypothetical protein
MLMEIIRFDETTGRTTSVFIDANIDDLIAIEHGADPHEVFADRYLEDDEIDFIVSGLSPEEVDRLFEAEGFTGGEWAYAPDFDDVEDDVFGNTEITALS